MDNLYKTRLASIIKRPIISEKSTVNAEKNKIFVFEVDKSATKKQVKLAVENMFEVEVNSVNLLNIKGKSKRFGRTLGQRSDWKKAYIKLKPDFDISFSVA